MNKTTLAILTITTFTACVNSASAENQLERDDIIAIAEEDYIMEKTAYPKPRRSLLTAALLESQTQNDTLAASTAAKLQPATPMKARETGIIVF